MICSNRSGSLRRLFATAVFLSILSAPAAAVQPTSSLQPVLFDAEDQPLGIVASVDGGHMILSIRGYRASPRATYDACVDCTPRPIAFTGRRYYASGDCSGEAIIGRAIYTIPSEPLMLEDDFAGVARATRNINANSIRSGDLVYVSADLLAGAEIEAATYYIPKGSAAVEDFHPRSYEFRQGICTQLDPTDQQTVERFGYLTVEGEGLEAQFSIPGPVFPEATLMPWEATITGFETASFVSPVEVRWVDVARVFTAGFEPVATTP